MIVVIQAIGHAVGALQSANQGSFRDVSGAIDFRQRRLLPCGFCPISASIAFSRSSSFTFGFAVTSNSKIEPSCVPCMLAVTSCAISLS